MSSNPPDPNELIRLLLQQQAQQQQNQQPQQAPQQQQSHSVAASINRPYNQYEAPPSNLGGANELGSLVAQYLNEARGQSTAAGPSSPALSSLLSALPQAAPIQLASSAATSNISGPQNLLALSGILSTINQNIAAAASQRVAPQPTGFGQPQPLQGLFQQPQLGQHNGAAVQVSHIKCM